jgi:D-alanyl-lipoteichoic acid acyltransferase DltB (MBOAT superfamily)
MVTNGLRLMLWGFFKKMVIADNLALLVDSVYNQPSQYQGASLVLATLFYTFQIYCDFSGYSDIAIGAAQVMGFTTMENFNRPYFSQSVPEFWRRWHISLSTWFRDYLYIPLGGNRISSSRWYFNLFIVLLICGLWHGANWTFVAWGGVHGVYLILSAVTQKMRRKGCQMTGIDQFPKLHRSLRVAITFLLISFAWIFFRANTISDAFYLTTHLWTGWDRVSFQRIPFWEVLRFEFIVGISSIFVLLLVEKMQGDRDFAEMIFLKPIWIRWPLYYVLMLSILLLGHFGQRQFIYFQF